MERHRTMLVGPAYGRVYKTVEAAKADFDNGKDFRVVPDGPYMSKRDLDYIREHGFLSLLVGCGDGRQVFSVELA